MVTKTSFLDAVHRAGKASPQAPAAGEAAGTRQAERTGERGREPADGTVPAKPERRLQADPANKERITTSMVIDREKYQQLKLLSAIEGRRFNTYLSEAIDDYLQKIAHRLPKL